MKGTTPLRRSAGAAPAVTGAIVAVLGSVAWPPAVAAAAPQPPRAAAGMFRDERAREAGTLPAVTRAAIRVRRVPSAAGALTTSATRQRCWSGRAHLESESLAGTTVYSWWQTLRWCSRDGRRISAWRLLDRGGETSTPGWSYAGTGRSGQAVTAGVLRSYTQERFSFSVLWTSYTSTPCAQIRATAQGRATISTACGL